jgi:hypothetical protein
MSMADDFSLLSSNSILCFGAALQQRPEGYQEQLHPPDQLQRQQEQRGVRIQRGTR